MIFIRQTSAAGVLVMLTLSLQCAPMVTLIACASCSPSLTTLVEHEARTSDADLTRMGYLQTDREERIVSETAAVCSQFSYVGRCILLRKFVYLGSCWRFLNNGSVLISGSP